MNELIIVTAKYLIIASVLIWMVYAVRLEQGSRWAFLIRTVAAAMIAIGLAKLSSHFISDPRPFIVQHITPLIPHADDNGFPSDHTLLASLLGFMVLTKSRILGVIMLFIALAIGASRVAASVHHPLDIAGSFVISALAVVIVIYAVKLIAKKSATPAV